MKKPDKKYPLSVVGDLLASTPQSEIVFMPDKIYTDNRGVYAELPIFSQTNANIEYIRKNAILKLLKGYNHPVTRIVIQEIIDKLNSM